MADERDLNPQSVLTQLRSIVAHYDAGEAPVHPHECFNEVLALIRGLDSAVPKEWVEGGFTVTVHDPAGQCVLAEVYLPTEYDVQGAVDEWVFALDGGPFAAPDDSDDYEEDIPL